MRQEPALRVAGYSSVNSNKQMFAYLHEKKGYRFLILLNLSHCPNYFNPQTKYMGKVRANTENEREGIYPAGILHQAATKKS